MNLFQLFCSITDLFFSRRVSTGPFFKLTWSFTSSKLQLPKSVPTTHPRGRILNFLRVLDVFYWTFTYFLFSEPRISFLSLENVQSPRGIKSLKPIKWLYSSGFDRVTPNDVEVIQNFPTVIMFLIRLLRMRVVIRTLVVQVDKSMTG